MTCVKKPKCAASQPPSPYSVIRQLTQIDELCDIGAVTETFLRQQTAILACGAPRLGSFRQCMGMQEPNYMGASMHISEELKTIVDCSGLKLISKLTAPLQLLRIGR
jgi:hypothetical protein